MFWLLLAREPMYMVSIESMEMRYFFPRIELLLLCYCEHEWNAARYIIQSISKEKLFL